MSGPQNAKAAPAGTGDGSLVAKQLGSAFEPGSYSENANRATSVRADMLRLIAGAAASGGIAAFEMSKRAAAIHEAGHSIVFAHEGEHVRSVRIKSRNYGGQLYWGGATFAGKEWVVDANTPIEFDRQRIRFDVAGLLAERAHEGDRFRPAPSYDELARARALSNMVACKTGEAPIVVLHTEVMQVKAILEEHRRPLLVLAAELERHGWIRGAKLAALLAPVRSAIT